MTESIKAAWPYMALVAIVVFAVYANTLNGDFVYDDRRQIAANPLIQEPAQYWTALTSDVWAGRSDGTVAVSNYWRPTFTAWCIVIFKLAGDDPFGWHLANILLHLGVCLLAFAFLLRWGVPTLWATVSTLLFAVHPVHTESVAWISGSPDLLFSFFFLASLIFADRAALPASKACPGQIAAAVVFYVLALGAKEVAMTSLMVFPVLFLARAGTGDVAKIRSGYGNVIPTVVPFAAAAAGYFIARLYVLGAISRPVEDGPGTFSAILSAPLLALFYFRQMIFPYWLGPNHAIRPVDTADPYLFFLPLLIVAALGAGLWYMARGPLARVGAALLFFPLLPAFFISSFPREEMAHDRYLYLPVLGMIILTGALLNRFLGQLIARYETVWLGASAIVLALFSFQSVTYNRVWANDLYLWRHAVDIDPRSAVNSAQLGAVLTERERPEDALRAYDSSIAIRPTPLALMGRARILSLLGQPAEAVTLAEQVLAMPPESMRPYTRFQAYEAKAVALQQLQRDAEALEMLEIAHKELPHYRAGIVAMKAVLLYSQGKKAEALSELEAVRSTAVRENIPSAKMVFFRLGLLYAELGRNDEARRELRLFLAAPQTRNVSEMAGYRDQAVQLLAKLAVN
jgi:protein O-mannosyl-transferase